MEGPAQSLSGRLKVVASGRAFLSELMLRFQSVSGCRRMETLQTMAIK